MSTSVYTQATLNTSPLISISFQNFQILLLSLNYIVHKLKTVVSYWSKLYLNYLIIYRWSNVINQSLPLKLFGVCHNLVKTIPHISEDFPINWKGKILIESNNKKRALYGEINYTVWVKNKTKIWGLICAFQSSHFALLGQLGLPVRWTADGHTSTINRNINNVLEKWKRRRRKCT